MAFVTTGGVNSSGLRPTWVQCRPHVAVPLRGQALRVGVCAPRSQGATEVRGNFIAPYRAGAPMRCRGAFASVSATATAFPMAGQRNGLPHTRCTCTETRSPFPSHADRPQCCQTLPSGGRYDHSCSLVQARISPDCRRITAVPSGTRKPLELIRALRMSRVEHSRHLVQVISLVVQISGQPYHLAQELTPITGVSFAQRPQRTITNQRDNGPAPSRSARTRGGSSSCEFPDKFTRRVRLSVPSVSLPEALASPASPVRCCRNRARFLR